VIVRYKKSEIKHYLARLLPWDTSALTVLIIRIYQSKFPLDIFFLLEEFELYFIIRKMVNGGYAGLDGEWDNGILEYWVLNYYN